MSPHDKEAFVLAVTIFALVFYIQELSFRRRRKEQPAAESDHNKQQGKQYHFDSNDSYDSTNHNNSKWPFFYSAIAQNNSVEENHRAKERRFWERQIRIAKWLNGITALAAVVAAIGLGFVYLSIIHADQGTIDANRAWVSPIDTPSFWQPPVLGEPVVIQFPVGNSGRQPAIDVRLRVSFDKVPNPKEKGIVGMDLVVGNACENGYDEKDSPDIFPNKSSTFIQTTPVSVLWDDKLQSDEMWIRAKSCVTYYSFGIIRKTWFCTLFGPVTHSDKRFKIGVGCRGGNGAT